MSIYKELQIVENNLLSSNEPDRINRVVRMQELQKSYDAQLLEINKQREIENMKIRQQKSYKEYLKIVRKTEPKNYPHSYNINYRGDEKEINNRPILLPEDNDV